MREGRNHAAQGEEQGQPRRAARLQRPAVVVDVLGEREAEADHGGVDHPVHGAVELVPAGPVEMQQDRALERLLDDGGAGHGGPALADRGIHDAVDDARDHHGHGGAPEKGDRQQVAGLRLEAVEPEHDPDVEGQRQHRHDGRDREHAAASPGGRQCEHGRRDQPEAEQPAAGAHHVSR